MLAIFTAATDSPFLKSGSKIAVDLGDVSAERAIEVATNLMNGGLSTHVAEVRSSKKKGDVEVTSKYGCTCFGREIADVPTGAPRPVALSFTAPADAAEALIFGRLADLVVLSVGEPEPAKSDSTKV